ncbi:MAG: lysophospholipase L1-like esterase [Myxococcota bacterium]|jgi:lysophospholipase L1-like esterase
MFAKALRTPWTRALLAAVLSWGVLFNTAAVTMHNLGARPDIGYINGGKVFRLTGTMWYHVPGLQEIGLAPQNIGGQINLRNNEFAMLERDVRSVERIEVDVGLESNAMLLVILDRHREGTFWAVRLTAFEHENTPFINALIRFEKGRVVKRIPLDQLGEQTGAGDHSVSVVLKSTGHLQVTVDDKSQELPFDVGALKPGLALGCGELNTTIHRWAVTGTDAEGRPLEFEESFSIFDTYGRSDAPLSLLATFLWLLLLGGPLLKVLFETRVSPLELLPRALLLPTPRWIFGLLCMIPITPLVVQWSLGGLYVLYAWMTLWEALAEGRHVWKVGESSGKGLKMRLPWLGAAGMCFVVSLLLFFGSGSLREAVVGSAMTAPADTPVAADRSMQRLNLGERIALETPSGGTGPLRVSLKATLGPDQVLRVDVLRALPTEADVYQVDRSQDRPEAAPGEEDEPGEGEENQGPGDYELRAASALISTTAELPGMLRWLAADKLELSPWSGWILEPGTYEIAVTVDPPLAVVSVDGVIRDFRSDIPHTFNPGAIQILSQTGHVIQVGDVVVDVPQKALSEASDNIGISNVLASTAVVFVAFGFLLLLMGLATRVSFSARAVIATLLRGMRGTFSLIVWLGWWLCERNGWTDLAGERMEIAIGAIALLIGLFNVTQIIRQSGGTDTWKGRAIAGALLLTMAFTTFEAMAHLYPERRHNWTHSWNHQISPRYFWMHDPMIRRLNPWFIDQRFKRRDWATKHPGKVRVVVFGGSQSYGWGIPSMDRMAFSDQLERALHARGYGNVEVLNAAFPGVKTGTGLRWFAGNLLRYEPDIAVINFVVNEFMNVDQYHVWSGDRATDAHHSTTASGGLLEQWRGVAMGNHLSQIIVADVYEVYAMEQYLRWWHHTAEAANMELVFSIEPTNLYVESGGNVIMRGETNIGAAQKIYRKLGAELNVPVYDALPGFVDEQENMWFYDTMHMSRLGHRVFAENLADQIVTSYLEPAQPAPAAK